MPSGARRRRPAPAPSRRAARASAPAPGQRRGRRAGQRLPRAAGWPAAPPATARPAPATRSAACSARCDSSRNCSTRRFRKSAKGGAGRASACTARGRQPQADAVVAGRVGGGDGARASTAPTGNRSPASYSKRAGHVGHARRPRDAALRACTAGARTGPSAGRSTVSPGAKSAARAAATNARPAPAASARTARGAPARRAGRPAGWPTAWCAMAASARSRLATAHGRAQHSRAACAHDEHQAAAQEKGPRPCGRGPWRD